MLITVYHLVLGTVRACSNALAVPIWWGVLQGMASVLQGGPLFRAGVEGFRAGMDWTLDGPLGLICAGLFAVLGIVHAVRAASGGAYDSPLGFVGFLLDHSWALPNTILASIFATLTAGIAVDKTATKGSARLVLQSGVFGPDYATTIGSVTAGTQVQAHELQHVIQSWLFGPFFYPLYLANYVVNLVPWWLLLKLLGMYPKAKIEGVVTYFTHGVYPFTLFEIWAYLVEGDPP